MKFKSIRDLKLKTNSLLEEAEKYGPTVITRNGKPIALLRAITEDDLEISAKSLWPKLRNRAEKSGFGPEDVNRLIKQARKKQK